jgi:hypothetical protein
LAKNSDLSGIHKIDCARRILFGIEEVEEEEPSDEVTTSNAEMEKVRRSPAKSDL